MAVFQLARAARGGEASTSCSSPAGHGDRRRRRRAIDNRRCPDPRRSAAPASGGSRRLVIVAVSSSATPSSPSGSASAAAAAAPVAAAATAAATPTTSSSSTTTAALPTLPLAVVLEPPPPPPALQAGGGDGDGGLPPSDGGGGDGDEGGDGGERSSLFNPFAALAAGLSARCRADPEFLYKLLVECGLDLSIILGVNLAARGSRFLSELEFVLSQASVSLLCDFALVFILAPTGRASAASSLPAHVFQRGAFTTRSRLACLGARAVQYGAVGLSMGCAGSAIVRALVAAREAADDAYVPPATEQGVLDTGLAWCYFMAVSSNLRYNAINGIEEWAYSRAMLGAASPSSAASLLFSTPAAARSLSVALRLANNVFGAHSFIQLAKVLRLDKPREVRKKEKKGKATAATGARAPPQWWKRARAVVA